MRIIISIIFLFFTTSSFAQLSRKEKRAAKQNKPIDQPTTLSPGSSQGKYASKQSKNKSKSEGPTYNSEKEFAQRMEDRVKTNRKNEKLMLKPQYSNPAYFGHKRPPKKRPADKMKFCKECGIRH